MFFPAAVLLNFKIHNKRLWNESTPVVYSPFPVIVAIPMWNELLMGDPGQNPVVVGVRGLYFIDRGLYVRRSGYASSVSNNAWCGKPSLIKCKPVYFTSKIVLQTPYFIFTALSLSRVSVCFISDFVGQIMEVRLFSGAAIGPFEAGSGHCGKEGSGESDSSPALCWSNPGPSAANSSTSLTGCQRWWVWQEGAPMVPSRWTASTCGTQSGGLFS